MSSKRRLPGSCRYARPLGARRTPPPRDGSSRRAHTAPLERPRGPLVRPPPVKRRTAGRPLLDFDACPGLLELAADRVCLVLRDALLDRIGRPVDEVLRLLEAGTVSCGFFLFFFFTPPAFPSPASFLPPPPGGAPGFSGSAAPPPPAF